jgi:hypothetical protein
LTFWIVAVNSKLLTYSIFPKEAEKKWLHSY